MEIVVVIQNEDQLATAGVRIRYERLRPHLEAAGHRLTLVPIDSFRGNDAFQGDAYLISKCHDARSIVLAHALRAAGRQVGIDFFDDYFSQIDDGRFVHLRQWLVQIRPCVTFGLCATGAMARRLATLIPDAPVHVLNDPFDAFDDVTIAGRVERKSDTALTTGRIDIVWFGISDNPFFPIGIEDLSAFEAPLAAIRSAGFEPRLTVLTNRRALTVRRLEMLARLPVPVAIEEWTEPLEAELLETSLVSFLPVNAQPFSTVKSLNRAVTALTGGTQVLSVGHPLYAALEAFLYRDALALIQDLRLKRPKVRRATLPGLHQLLGELADPVVESGRLVTFVQALPETPGVKASASPLAIVLGVVSPGVVHKFAQRMQGLSVASPFFTAQVHVDVRLERSAEGGLALIVSEKAARYLVSSLRERMIALPIIEKKQFYRIALDSDRPEWTRTGNSFHPGCERIADYPHQMAQFYAMVAEMFPSLDLILSEDGSPFLFNPAARSTPAEVRHAG